MQMYRGKKPQRADTGTVFSTAAEHFVKTLRNKKQEELLGMFNTRLACPAKPRSCTMYS